MGGQFLPPCEPGQNSTVLLVPGLCAGSSNRIEAAKHVLIDVRFAFDELDGSAVVAAIEKPQVAVARDVDQTFHGASAALIIDQNRRRRLIPIPRFVRCVLKISFDRARCHVDCKRRSGIQIIAGPPVAHPRSAVASAPVGGVCLGIVVARDPHRTASVFPYVAPRPRLAARLARRGNRVGAP
jgi:hypothetical protein